MKKFDIYISFSYSVRVREFEKVGHFTLSDSEYYYRSLVVDNDLYDYNTGFHAFESYSSFTRRLKDDFNELMLKALDFVGIPRSRTLDELSFSDCHKIDLVVSTFEQIECDFLKLETDHYFHTTGYFDDSVNPGCVEVNLFMVEKDEKN